MSESFVSERDHLQGLHWQCFGCGQENRLGLRLNIRLVGDRTECTFTPIAEFQGPPGVTHSGVIAAVLDEVMSQLIYAQLQLAVTRKIEVTYRRPLRVGQTYYFTAWIAKQNTRIIAAKAEARDAEGNQVARARGIFAPMDEERVARFLDKE
ncbi:acyl-coenzyme A thioesterase PaaI-like protein [Symbiobacterium terraclitae]|uniref:Acyl-coenzyme A thioesterase PaaI-like protein n=1 Tax=Symbiobacterium terraclitae TaxID=557451 RepID=A0ABS4JV16_9FIRM|nr:PaaI family thioesterase [Symbiobacterium terraclitae]MBP2019353.1 acyl-coenzyme A thioesterase PaaI-like protein [Symbiobacterium terraclitae]